MTTPRTAGDLLHTYLRVTTVRLREALGDARGHDHEGVHQVRVNARRLRAALRAYGPLLATDPRDALVEDLRWLGQQLSPVRDLQVVSARLLAEAEQEPPGLQAGRVRTLLRRRLDAAARPVRLALAQTLDEPRLQQLLDRLGAVVEDPGWTRAAAKKAPKVVSRRLDRAWRRVQRRAALVSSSEDPDRALHEVRKAAKRLRYAADVAGAERASVAKAAKRLQTTLGEVGDSAVAQQWWLRLGHDPEAGSAAFTYGRLHATEVRRQHQARRRYDERLRALTDVMGAGPPLP